VESCARSIELRAQQPSGAPFGQIILAAADVDADSFRKFSAAYTKVARQTTLYVSKRDHAVEASRWLHQFPRAGFMPPVCVVSGIDTIGVANIDMTLLGHGDIGEAREVLTDIHQLIATGSPPAQRFGLEEQKTENGERYWPIRA
jgi:esterase/lipase superfamily enzyme